MAGNYVNDELKTLHSRDGLRIFYLETNQYKTNIIKMYWMNRMDKNIVSHNSLLAQVLGRGSNTYPTSKILKKELEGLYGASCSTGVIKHGGCQTVYLNFAFPADKYVQMDLSVKIAGIANDLMFNPFISDRKFNDEYVFREKENLITLIEGRKNDKMHYAVERCEEEIFMGEGAGLCEFGDVDVLRNISSGDLADRYYSMLNKNELCVFIAGNYSDAALKGICSLFVSNRNKYGALEVEEHFGSYVGRVRPRADYLREVVEQMDVSQAKLTLGMTTEIPAGDEDYISVLLANSIYGGGLHSKLFNVIREKESLAYYCSSNMDKYTGVIYASGGIEAENKEHTLRLMIDLLDEVKQGNITDIEMDSAKKNVINTMKTIKDTQGSLLSFSLGRLLTGERRKIDELIEAVSAVTKDDIVRSARNIRPHTVYFLCGGMGDK